MIGSKPKQRESDATCHRRTSSRRANRFTFDEEHFFVDLVFYNRLLQCYVLIDLKTDKLKHQDLGQMQMKCELVDIFKQLLSSVITLLLIMLLLIKLLHIFVQE